MVRELTQNRTSHDHPIKEDYSEQGASLLIVLITVMLIFSFASILIFTALNSTLQFNKTEEQIQAVHLAEMGIEHFEAIARSELSSINWNDIEQNPFEASFIAAFITNNLPTTEIILSSADFSYKLSFLGATNLDDNTIQLKYSSYGMAHDTSKRITGKMNISLNSTPITHPCGAGGCSFPPDGWVDGTDIVTDGTVNVERRQTITTGHFTVGGDLNTKTGGATNLTINGDLTVMGTSNFDNHSTITVNNGDGYFQDSVNIDNQAHLIINNGAGIFGSNLTIFNQGSMQISGGPSYFNEITLKNNSTFKIKGDAYFAGNINGIKDNGNGAALCVDGTVFLKTGLNETERDIISPFAGTCDTLNPKNGFYAKNVVTINQIVLPSAPIQDGSVTFNFDEVEYE